MVPTARNSLCQFWKDWNQNSDCGRTARADPGGAVLVLLGAVLVGAGDGVTDEGGDEQHGEGDEQAVLVEVSQAPPRRTGHGASGSSRCSRGSSSRGSSCSCFDSRTFLQEEHGEQHEGAHLQELALPVLERRFGEMARREIPPVAEPGLAVLHRVRDGGSPAGQALGHQEHGEDGEARQRECVALEETGASTRSSERPHQRTDRT